MRPIMAQYALKNVAIIIALTFVFSCAHSTKRQIKHASKSQSGPPYPIVMVHGFAGFKAFGDVEYFYNVQDALEAEGFVVFTPSLPPYSESTDRALVLGRYIDAVLKKTGKQKVNIIAHSQGGIDSRRTISALGYSDRVSTLITVATPHRGTLLADLAGYAPAESLNPAGKLVAWMVGALDKAPFDPNWDSASPTHEGWTPAVENAIKGMSAEGMRAFNAEHPNPPGVKVFSVVGYSNLQPAPAWCEAIWPRPEARDVMDPLLFSAALVLGGNPNDHQHNDGVVPSGSQRWGTLIGCIAADHYDQVGQIVDVLPNVVSGFDHIEFYRVLAYFLNELDKNDQGKAKAP